MAPSEGHGTLRRGHGNLDEKMPILVMNVKENSGKFLKEIFEKNAFGLKKTVSILVKAFFFVDHLNLDRKTDAPAANFLAAQGAIGVERL